MSTRGYASGAATTGPGIRYTALDGVVGGLIGGVLMGRTSMVLFWLRDLGFWYVSAQAYRHPREMARCSR
jgi:predicted lipid-binding transport protein (Tim44 family)